MSFVFALSSLRSMEPSSHTIVREILSLNHTQFRVSLRSEPWSIQHLSCGFKIVLFLLLACWSYFYRRWAVSRGLYDCESASLIRLWAFHPSIQSSIAIVRFLSFLFLFCEPFLIYPINFKGIHQHLDLLSIC